MKKTFKFIIHLVSVVVQALHLPDGGIIKLEESGSKVYFHRARAFLGDGGQHQISVRSNLLDVVKVGDAVSVDIVSNRIPGAADEDAVYFRDCGAKLVALAVYPLKLFANVPRSKLRSVGAGGSDVE